MVVLIRCPECNAETRLSLIESKYEGPFRCWKCKTAFFVVAENEDLKSWSPISEEELKEYTE